jgi:DNA adenine methylase
MQPLWAPHALRRYVEPFAGGLGMVLGLMPASALLNDINIHLINFYSWLARGVVGFDIPMEHTAEMYYGHRTRFNELVARGGTNTAEAAALFYYLNRSGFNGLCRFNQRGRFNVPIGRYTTVAYCRDFSPFASAFAGWDFSAGDFESVHLDPTDFVYADPPFDVPFTSYAGTAFSWKDQVRVAEWLARHPGPAVLCNAATDRIVDLYTRLGFELHHLTAPRRIACTGDRTPALELLATRNLTKTVNPQETEHGLAVTW